MPSMRNAIATGAISLFVVIIFLLFIEVFLRTTQFMGATPSTSLADPVIRWRFVPGSTVWDFKENDNPVQARINRFGWRDLERTKEKPPGVFRVAALGDSFVEARQVELEATFPLLTERRWNAERADSLEVLNFGLSGLTQTEEYLLLKSDVQEFDPDMVVLFFYPINDITDVRPAGTSRSRPYFEVDQNGLLKLDTSFADTNTYRLRQILDPLKRHSALANYVIQSVDGFRQNYQRKQRRARQADNVSQPVATGRDGISPLYSMATNSPDKDMLANYELNKRLITEMVRFCTDADLQFLLVNISFVYHADQIAELKSVDSSFDPRFFDNDLAEFSRAAGINYLGLQVPFEEYFAQEGQSLNWGKWNQGHWNYQGHLLVSELLMGKIQEQRDAMTATQN